MEPWSTKIDNFKIKVFLDTNILCYLVDDTYPALTSFISTLSKMPVIDLISSEFVLTEFIGVRKQEHYFRSALNLASTTQRTINFSSLIKHNKRFDIPDFGYNVLKNEIVDGVKLDEDTITTKFGIDFCCGFNSALLKPTSDICLSSRISKEDSLVLASAVYMSDTRIINNKVLLFTNDRDFCTWAKESESDIDLIFEKISAKPPQIEHIANIGGKKINTTNIAITDMCSEATQFIRSQMIEVYGNLYIGSIITIPEAVVKKNMICLKVQKDTTIQQGTYILILGKNLDFVYTHSKRIEFWHCNAPISETGFVSSPGDNKITFIVSEDMTIIPDITQWDEIFNKISAEGNLVFIHPDN